MTVHVAVMGPANPAEFAPWFAGREAEALTRLPGLGGAPVNALVRALLAAGTRVDLVTLVPGVCEQVVFRGEGLTLLVGGYRAEARRRAADLFLSERRAVASLLLRSQAEVLNPHWTYEFAWPAIRSGRPCVVTAHDAPLTVMRNMPDIYRAVRTVMAGYVALSAHNMTAVSPVIARSWTSKMLYRGSMAVVPNVVEPSASNAGERRELVVLCVGNGSALKNVRSLLRAFVQIRRVLPQTLLELVGPDLGPDGATARWAVGAGLADGVGFAGSLPHDEVLGRMRRASVLCHPSLEESFGMALAEAMSVGLPVVAGDQTGAVPWLLREGAAGCLTDVRDPHEIAGSVIRVLTDHGYARSLSAAGLARTDDFAPEAVAKAYLSAFEHTLGRRATGTARGVA